MKRTIIIIGIMIISTASAFSQLAFGVLLGSSTPNNKVNEVYNNQSITDIESFINKGTKTGYHILAKLRFPMSENLTFVGGFGWHRFPESYFDVVTPDTDEEQKITLSTVQNVFPVSAGLNLYLVRSLISIYGTGELNYNYISNTVDVVRNDISLPLNLNKTPNDSRVGFGLGAGVDLSLVIFDANIEAKYNMLNLIGKESGEPTKAYYTLSVGIFFGSSKPSN